MHIIRPITLADLPAVQALVGTIRDGLTSLPNDPSFLEARIHASLQAFYPSIRHPGSEHYLFVLEDLASGRVLGTAGLIARVGGFDPFYSYERRRERFAHPPLGLDHEIEVLHLKTNFKGPSEVCSLFLHPDARAGGLGRLLSRSRFLFVAAFPHRFADTVIAEMRGWIGENGTSPFWESVARPFFQREFSQADFLSGLGEKDFIAALMPRHPIYVPLLPPAAQAVIGRVHRETEPALRLLEQEGFTATREVDIFDAGPLLAAPRDQLRTVRERLHWTLDQAGPSPSSGDPLHLIANPQLAFRATLAPLPAIPGGPCHLPTALADALQLVPGAPFLSSLLRSS